MRPSVDERVPRSGPRPVARARRGAVLPLVAILLVALVLMAGVAIDLGRMHLAAAELQAAADAAALAGARSAQFNARTAGTAVPAAAADIGGRNRAYNSPAQIAAADVRPAWHDPVTRTTNAATWSAANAVEVTARAQGTYMFAGVAGATAPAVARRGTVWTGNMNAAECIKPFAMHYTALYRQLVGGAGYAPDFTQAQLGDVAARTNDDRTVVFVQTGRNTAKLHTGEWAPADFQAVSPLDVYGKWVSGSDCASASAAVDQGDLAIVKEPVAKVTETTNGYIGSVCNFKGASDAACYATPSATVAGVRIRAIWVDVRSDSGTSGCVKRGRGRAYGNCKGFAGSGDKAPLTTVRMIGQLVLMCYYRATTDRCGPQPAYPGGGWSHRLPQTDYPAGTIVGIFEGVSSIELTPDIDLGNRISNTQRLILVQ